MKVEIDRSPPAARGVTQLMYVGDDEAVDKATAAVPPTTGTLAVGAISAVVALQSRGITRLVAGGIASWVAYRYVRAR